MVSRMFRVGVERVVLCWLTALRQVSAVMGVYMCSYMIIYNISYMIF